MLNLEQGSPSPHPSSRHRQQAAEDVTHQFPLGAEDAFQAVGAILQAQLVECVLCQLYRSGELRVTDELMIAAEVLLRAPGVGPLGLDTQEQQWHCPGQCPPPWGTQHGQALGFHFVFYRQLSWTQPLN